MAAYSGRRTPIGVHSSLASLCSTLLPIGTASGSTAELRSRENDSKSMDASRSLSAIVTSKVLLTVSA